MFNVQCCLLPWVLACACVMTPAADSPTIASSPLMQVSLNAINSKYYIARWIRWIRWMRNKLSSFGKEYYAYEQDNLCMVNVMC